MDHPFEELREILEFQHKMLGQLGRMSGQQDRTLVLLNRTLDLLSQILHRLPQPLTARIAIRFQGELSMSLNALSLNVGQTSQASIAAFLADGVTPSGGVPSNVAFSFDDPSATVQINADGLTATVTAMAASTAGAVSGTATCTITDTDGVVSQWSQAFTILVGVTPPPPQQLTQSIAVSFSDPTP
jgi:hypothetical protein